jgi:hypothetical protein
MRRARLASLLVLALPLACNGTTGDKLVSFYAAAKGPADAQAGQPYTFVSDKGFTVTLTRAVMHVGAVYLDQSAPTAGQQQEPCTLPGTYVGEVRGGRDVDMLSPDAQLFPVAGDGSTIPSAIGQVWLTGGDVFAKSDSTVVLSIDGTATGGGATIPFSADLTIDEGRSPAATGSALPGENPLCEQRIVTPIPAPMTLSQGGTLVLHLDPKALFTNVDFSQLPQISSDPPAYGFTNDDTNQPSVNLYANLRAAGGVYAFEWTP